ncbi:MAG: hypothetical protein KC613_19230 [Myxococcales bacterium]|nr:hypothetical protein [Myxococcales bacterium]MCB9526108.1 hypothetical protein [Myxococcales bacterium]
MEVHARESAGDNIAQQHQSLRQQCEALDECSGIKTLKRCLSALEADLAEHFDLEESPVGREAVLGPRALAHADRMDALFKQHPLILDTVRGLLAQADQLEVGVHRLVDLIHKHERAETELMADALYDDFGGGD